MALTPIEVSNLGAAATAGVVSGMARLVPHLAADRWLGARNRYAMDPAGQVARSFKTPTHLRPRQLAEYVAASAPVHCADGWNFLGKAIHSLLTGDADTARHLGYYAELRGAVSLLACGGVGVFNGEHIAVEPDGRAVRLINNGNRRGTHSAAWVYLEEWAKKADAASLLGQAVRISGSPLVDWIAAVPAGAAWAPLGEWLLLSLGLDVKQLADDRSARNRASYRASSIRAGVVPAPNELTSFVEELWGLLEPASTGFDGLDLRILSKTLSRSFRANTGHDPATHAPAYELMLDGLLAEMVPTTELADALKARLAGDTTVVDPGVLGEALTARQATHPRHHLGVLGRAAGLLRLATGSTRVVMRRAGVDIDDAWFWWTGVGMRRGVWGAAAAAADLLDEWQDVADALIDVSDFILSVHGEFTLEDLARETPRSVLRLGQLDVVPLWELAS